MKAIKIASGFAVTALAAAVSMQANAAAHGMAAETTVETSGEINVRTMINMVGDTTLTNYIKDETDGDNDHFELTVETKVTHGPFSGTLVVREHEFDYAAAAKVDSDEDGFVDFDLDNSGDISAAEKAAAIAANADFESVDIFIEDLIVTDGPISFGQLNDIVMTDGLFDTIRDEDDGTADLSYPVEAAFRYTNGPLKVQAEGSGTVANLFGIGALYTVDVGMGNVYLEGQFSTDSNSATTEGVFLGVGAELMPTDELTIVAAFESQSETAAKTAMGVRGTYATDALTAYGAYYDPTTGADDEEIYVGGSMSMGMLTPYAEYGLTTKADGGDYLEAGVKYANGAIGGKAEVTMNNLDAATADDPIIELDVTYSAESGVKYAAEYTQQGDQNANAAETNQIELIAAYSF